MNQEAGYEFEWNAAIENDGADFEVLPEGDCDFEVSGFERARHPGSEKLPPCNKAVVTLKISSPNGNTTIKHNLFLHTKTEGMLCAFFTALGHRKKGERITMDWNKVVGSQGRCKLGTRKWIGKDGAEHMSNEVKKFYEPDEQGVATKFEPGRF